MSTYFYELITSNHQIIYINNSESFSYIIKASNTNGPLILEWSLVKSNMIRS